MRIGELSRRTGVGAHQLRYYESRGLLEPVRRSNGYRDFGPDAVTRVTQIRRLLAAGLSTEDIGSLMPCVLGEEPDFVSCPEVLDLLRSRGAHLDRQIETLAQSREALRSYIDATERDPAAGRPWDAAI